MITLWTHILIV